MAKMLMGAFDSPAQADTALRELEDRGYTPEQISTISSSNKFDGSRYETDTGNNVAKSATSGAVTGGVIGGLAGVLASVGVVPAIAGLFIGGPIVAALGLAGAAAVTASGALTGAAAGGLIGALTGIGVSKEDATTYDNVVKEGGVVIGLSGREEMTAEARSIMEKNGARDISTIDMQDGDMKADSTHETITEARIDTDEAEQPSGRQQATREPVFGERREATADGRMDAPAEASMESPADTRTSAADKDMDMTGEARPAGARDERRERDMREPL